MTASKGKASTKVPPASPIGMTMNSLAERMKKHKVNKDVHGALSTMHMASSGTPLNEDSRIIKTAYIAGYKYASDSVSENSSTQNSALGNTDKTEEEGMLETLRRGWPDPKKQHLRDIKGEAGRPTDEDNKTTDYNYSYGDLKDRAKLTPGSPDTTI